MNDIQIIVQQCTLDYFKSKNCIIEKTQFGYIIKTEDINIKNILGKDETKISFKVSENSDYQFISPGNSVLHNILLHTINQGAVISKKKLNNMENTPVIRFNFYILLESVMSENYLESIDIDLNTNKMIEISSDDIGLESENYDLMNFDIDYAYITAIEELEKRFQKRINIFKEKIEKMAQTEFDDLENDYKIKSAKIEEKSKDFRSRGISGKRFDDLIDENTRVRNEKIDNLAHINNKFKIALDFALISAIIIH